MITGFNTDIVHDGVVYHVQTEDKGLDSPIILSLVYSGGEILASKRAPYEDLLASGFTEAALAERLKRQHTLICAAIHAGRIEDLKRMTGLQASRGRTRTDQIEIPQPPVKEPEPVVTAKPEVPNLLDEIELTPATPQYQPTVVEVAPEPPPAQFEPQPEPDVAAEPVTISSGSGTVADVYTVHDSRRQSPLGDLPSDQRLVVTLLEEQEFHSGASLTVRVKVSERSGKTDKPLNGITVSMKVLGTTFRPQIYTAKTGRNGIAAVALQIPKFTSGRAALLIRASVQENATEIRRLVHPGK